MYSKSMLMPVKLWSDISCKMSSMTWSRLAGWTAAAMLWLLRILTTKIGWILVFLVLFMTFDNVSLVWSR